MRASRSGVKRFFTGVVACYLAGVTLPTPADVKDLPFSAELLAAFAAVADAKVQALIDNCASWFGSAEVLQHTQRDEAVLYGAAHLLYLALVSEGAIGGGGGGGGVGLVSGRRLEGVGSISYAVTALTPEQENDWLMQRSPFSVKLNAILATFPPGVSTAQYGPAAP
jgi:hypothetical protein